MSWNFVRFHEIQFQTEPSFSFLSWKTKKFYPYKNIFFSRTAKIDPKDGISRLNFLKGFDHENEKKGVCSTSKKNVYCTIFGWHFFA